MTNAPVQGETLVRLNQAAKQIGVSYWALREWCRAGQVRYHRVGPKLLMISQAEIDRLLRESTITPAA